MAQILSTSIALPLRSRSAPRNSPVLGLKALIWPLGVLLLIKIALLMGPKLAGARATPHGECSGPFNAKCFTRLPAVSKTSTNPLSLGKSRVGDPDLTVDGLNPIRSKILRD